MLGMILSNQDDVISVPKAHAWHCILDYYFITVSKMARKTFEYITFSYFFLNGSWNYKAYNKKVTVFVLWYNITDLFFYRMILCNFSGPELMNILQYRLSKYCPMSNHIMELAFSVISVMIQRTFVDISVIYIFHWLGTKADTFASGEAMSEYIYLSVPTKWNIIAYLKYIHNHSFQFHHKSKFLTKTVHEMPKKKWDMWHCDAILIVIFQIGSKHKPGLTFVFVSGWV